MAISSFNLIIWSLAVILAIYAAYRKWFKKDNFIAVVDMFHLDGEGQFIRDMTPFKAYKKSFRSKEGEKTIHWIEIVGKKKKYLWRPIKFNETITTLMGNRYCALAWLGNNDFRLLSPKINKFKFTKLENGTYKKEKDENYSLEMINEEDHYFLAEMYETLNSLYALQESWFDKYVKPHIAIMLVGMICLLIVFGTSKDVKEMSQANLETAKTTKSMFQSALDKLTQTKVDDNTVKTSNAGAPP
jgi:hypothetical protein